MIFKKTNSLVVIFIVTLSFSINSCANEKIEINMEECALSLSAFDIYIKKNIPPIIRTSSKELENVADFINPNLITKLESYSDFYSLCFIKQAREADGSIAYRYNIISRRLASLIIQMLPIKEHLSSYPELIDVHIKSIEKDYIVIINEIEIGRNQGK